MRPSRRRRVRVRKLKMGMVGGGAGALIGAVHRAAALMDGQVELVAGALSSTPEKALASGKDIRRIMVTHGPAADPFWSVVKNGMDPAAKEMGVEVDYRAPNNRSRLRDCGKDDAQEIIKLSGEGIH